MARYAESVRSFQTVSAPEIRAAVERELGSALLWPESDVSLNPAFEPGGWIDELAEEGLLPPASD